MKRILLCDDEFKLCRARQASLASVGYTVECVTTGQAALARCAQPSFAVVRADGPWEDGFAETTDRAERPFHLP